MSQGVADLFDSTEVLTTDVVSIVVPEKGLRDLFGTLKPIFRKVEISRCIQFQVYGGRLFISANAPSLSYEARFDAPESKDLTVVCQYVDLSNMFGATGNCKITISVTGVLFETKLLRTNLMASVESLNTLEFDSVSYSPINTQLVKYAFVNALNLNAYAKAFKLNASFICTNNFMQIRYPTLYVQYPFSGFDSVLDYSAVQTLSSFIEGDTEIGMLGSMLVFKRGNEFIATSRTPVTACESVEDLMQGANFLGHIEARGSMAVLKDLQSSFGKSLCWAEFSNKAARYSVDTPQAVVSVSTSPLNEVLASFQIDIAMLHNILSTVGYEFDLFVKDNMYMAKSKVIAVFTCKS